MRRRQVRVIKEGNRIVVDPTTDDIHRILQPVLTFTAKRMLYGREAEIARQSGNDPPIEFTDWELFGEDHAGRIATSFGLYSRIRDSLITNGYDVSLKDLDPPDPSVFEPDFDRMFDAGVELRYGQEEFLIKLLSNPNGRFDAPPGYGKSFLIGLVGMVLRKARIHVVSKRVPVIRDRIYPALCQMLPDVGICCGASKRRLDARVMCYTADSLHHSNGDADILIGDECHELAADKAAASLAMYDKSRSYGFSASHDMRLDQKDLRVEALFGPVIYTLPYSTAAREGLVVPINVLWTKVQMDSDPCEGAGGPVERKRYGVWRNDYRNDLIALDARRYDDDTQVLITCETIDHAVNLKARLPEFALVYSENGMTPMDRRRYIKEGLLDANEPSMTTEHRHRMTQLFERGKLKKAICTTVWNVGVDFKNLAVLIRADAGGSPINDVQIPGRAARINADKGHAVVHDYTDQINRGFRAKASSRHSMYQKQGFHEEGWGPGQGEFELWTDRV